jgi:outer membrane protein OmpA-like peptidoglycan-associated protein
MMKYFWAILIFLSLVSLISADATIPSTDKKGTKDNPLLKRYEGSLIVAYEHKSFDEFTLPLSKLELVDEIKRDIHNNRVYEPGQKQILEGERTRIVYLIPADRSPLEVLRNYQEEIEGKGGKVLFQCKAEACGGNQRNSSSGGGGHQSLSMFLYPKERIQDPYFSNGNCAQTSRISDQRYLASELPDGGAHISVLTYTLHDDRHCKAFDGRTIAAVDILQTKDREQKMITVNASEMAQKIASTGSIALYGIYFDFNKADLKPESDATLDQIAQLMKNDHKLKLLVAGHTDNVGTFDFNMGLSQRRAAAVVTALTGKYGISKVRLMPVGLSFAAPVASNKSDDGRAKNRRVELVEN